MTAALRDCDTDLPSHPLAISRSAKSSSSPPSTAPNYFGILLSVSAFSLLRRRFPHRPPPVLPAAARRPPELAEKVERDEGEQLVFFPPVPVNAPSLGYWAPWGHHPLLRDPSQAPAGLPSDRLVRRRTGRAGGRNRVRLDRQFGDREGREAAATDDGT